MTSLPVLNVIGCGRLGRTVARLLVDARICSISTLVCATEASAASAAAFVGAGRPATSMANLSAVDWTLIATPDADIERTALALAASGTLRPGSLVFHCSGALSSAILGVTRDAGAAVASVHPVRSFADPDLAAREFRGTFCSYEGDAGAVEVLIEAFTKLGAEVFPVDPNRKLHYHAAFVFASNYLVALLDSGDRLLASAGVDSGIRTKLLTQLAQGTLDNVRSVGIEKALTGPIARGDHELVRTQRDAVTLEHPRLGALYSQLGKAAVDLAERAGRLSAEQAKAVSKAVE